MSAKNPLLDKYQELERKAASHVVVLTRGEVVSVDFKDIDRLRYPRDEGGKEAYEANLQMQELKPLLLQESRKRQIEKARSISLPDDQQKAMGLLKEIVRKWKTFGTKAVIQKELDALLEGKEIPVPEGCGTSTSISDEDSGKGKAICMEPCLLECLKLMAISEEVQGIWCSIEDAITNVLADGISRHTNSQEVIASAAETIDMYLGELVRISGLCVDPPPLLRDGEAAVQTRGSNPRNPRGPRGKRGSGELTNTQELMAATLRLWHQYENESFSCTNCTPITQEELARRCGFSKGKLTKQFFDDWLEEGGNAEYKRLCKRGDARALAFAIAKLSREGLAKINELLTDQVMDTKARRPGGDSHIAELDAN